MSYAFYFDGTVASISFAKDTGSRHGPRIHYDKAGNVTSSKWFVGDEEVTSAAYQQAAAADSSLPAYFADATRYKDLVENRALIELQRSRQVPKVRIPLQFDQSGNPIAAP